MPVIPNLMTGALHLATNYARKGSALMSDDVEAFEQCPRCWETAINTTPDGYKVGVCRACGFRLSKQEAPEWTI